MIIIIYFFTNCLIILFELLFDSLYGQKHRKICICITKCQAGFATEKSLWLVHAWIKIIKSNALLKKPVRKFQYEL